MISTRAQRRAERKADAKRRLQEHLENADAFKMFSQGKPTVQKAKTSSLKPAKNKKGHSGPKPILTAFETNRRRH